MRGLTSTIALAVVLAGLGGYLYFVELKKPAVSADAKAKAFDLPADDIEEIEITVTGGDKSRLQKTDGSWKLMEPVAADAEASEVSSMTSNLATLDIQRVINEDPGDLAAYGLNPPTVDVAFRAKGQKDFKHLLIGGKTPSGGDVYAKKPEEKRVFLISSYLNETFNRSAFDLRDKMILKLDRDKVDGLELAKGGTTLAFHREGSDWTIVKPEPMRADYSAIEGFLTSLSSAPMQKVVEQDAKDLKRYGLDVPSLTASALMGSSRASLLLGKTEGDATYAKDASRPAVYTVAQTVVTDLSKQLNDVRRKDLFDMRSFTANRVELKRGADGFTFEKTKDKDGKDVWRDAAGKDVDSTKVEDLLTKLSGLRALSFEAGPSAALKMPALTVTASFDEKKKSETVAFGRTGNDVVGNRTGEPGTAKIESMAFDEAMKALDALK